MADIQWQLRGGSCTMTVTRWQLHDGSHTIDGYTVTATRWQLHDMHFCIIECVVCGECECVRECVFVFFSHIFV